MKNKEDIINQLNIINQQLYSLDAFDIELQSIKEYYVLNNNQELAKDIWIFQKIIEIHKIYRNAFNLLKNKSYFEGWSELEKVEISIVHLKNHFLFNEVQYYLWHIEKSVKYIQLIFPYKLFGSSELLIKKQKCSICQNEISIRNSCGHTVREIYNGEMCCRIITDFEFLGMALVENPGNKFSVMFLTDEKTGEQIDHYNYDIVDYLFDLLISPYETWDLAVFQREIRKENYLNIGRNDLCACNSGKKFKKCCKRKIGEKYPHYEVIMENPSSKTLLTNTIKVRKTIM